MATNTNTTATNWNVQAICQAYNKEVKGFNAQVRFIFAHKDAERKPIVELPEGVDKTDATAKDIKEANRKAKAYNNGIDTANAICEILNITEETLKRDNLKALFKLATSRCKNVTTTGKAVKFTAMPKLVTKNVTGSENYYQVKELNTFELLAEAAKTLETDTRRVYEVTTAPTAGKDEEGNIIISNATGDIVNKEGLKLVGDRKTELFTKWEALTEKNYKANQKGTETADKEKAKTIKATELKATEETAEATAPTETAE